MNSPTLITGSSGFLGSNFIKNSGITNYYLTFRNKKLLGLQNRNYIFGDLYTKKNLEKIHTIKFDRLIHFAWEGLPNREKQYNERNYTNTKKLIDMILNKNPNCEINMMGSCLEYGDYIGEASENTKPRFLDDFAKSKLKILEFLDRSTLNYRWFRIFYPYGFGQHNNSILNYCFQEFKEKRVPLLKKPNERHDYIYVDDVTRLISRAITIKELKGVINIGSGKLTSNYEIMRELGKQMGYEINKKVNYNLGGLYANMSKVFEFVPKHKYTDLEVGIRKYLEAKK